MTVGQLIEILKKEDPNLLVVKSSGIFDQVGSPLFGVREGKYIPHCQGSGRISQGDDILSGDKVVKVLILK